MRTTIGWHDSDVTFLRWIPPLPNRSVAPNLHLVQDTVIGNGIEECPSLGLAGLVPSDDAVVMPQRAWPRKHQTTTNGSDKKDKVTTRHHPWNPGLRTEVQIGSLKSCRWVFCNELRRYVCVGIPATHTFCGHPLVNMPPYISSTLRD